jgi:hypothetical protein
MKIIKNTNVGHQDATIMKYINHFWPNGLCEGFKEAVTWKEIDGLRFSIDVNNENWEILGVKVEKCENPDLFDSIRNIIVKNGFDGLINKAQECSCYVNEAGKCGRMEPCCRFAKLYGTVITEFKEYKDDFSKKSEKSG